MKKQIPVLITLLSICQPAQRADADDHSGRRNRIEGMLLGSLIGDAAGGPAEFKRPDELRKWLPTTRDWEDERRLDSRAISQLSKQFRLLPYRELRPDPAPYGHWTRDAAPGTVTDDSRHKMVLMNALFTAQADQSLPLSVRDLAFHYEQYLKTPEIRKRPEYAELGAEGFAEYNKAARWILGNRNLDQALPPARLWSGVATNAGQMALLPIAAAHVGDPDSAYRSAYQLGFMDNGEAKDINSAIVAGLAAAMATADSPASERWEKILAAMRETDPFRYEQIPFVTRPAQAWIDRSREFVSLAEGSPKKLFRLLEAKGKPKYYWDAHFVLASSMAILEICDFDPLASLQLSLDLGHDTDSTAQLVGAFVGAMYGKDAFPASIRKQVKSRLHNDYGQSLDDWVVLLDALNDRTKYPRVVAIE